MFAFLFSFATNSQMDAKCYHFFSRYSLARMHFQEVKEKQEKEAPKKGKKAAAGKKAKTEGDEDAAEVVKVSYRYSHYRLYSHIHYVKCPHSNNKVPVNVLLFCL